MEPDKVAAVWLQVCFKKVDESADSGIDTIDN
jgi:hypothetical protein